VNYKTLAGIFIYGAIFLFIAFLIGISVEFFKQYDIKIVKQKPQYWHGEELVFENYIPWDGDEIWIVRNDRVKQFWTYSHDKWESGEIISGDNKNFYYEDKGGKWESGNEIEKF